MKKCLVTILALIYLSTSSGMILHMHYCMGKMVNWGLTQSHSKKCPRCGMERTAQEESGCCRDESRFVKNNTDQVQDDFATPSIHAFAAPAVLYPIVLIERSNTTPVFNVPQTHAPPISAEPAIYKQICSFLI